MNGSLETGRSAHNFKIVLLGQGCVGKTSLVLRYVEDRFNDRHDTTLQASFLNKKVNINGTRANLSIWDTAGQERFHALAPMYYRGANGAVLVYDITDKESFEKVKQWIKELKKIVGNDICLVIAGNKIDLEKNRQVPVDVAEEYANNVSAKNFYTSAKLNEGIDEVFLKLTLDMLQKEAELLEQSNNDIPSPRTIVVDDTDDSLNQTRTRSCCSGGS